MSGDKNSWKIKNSKDYLNQRVFSHSLIYSRKKLNIGRLRYFFDYLPVAIIGGIYNMILALFIIHPLLFYQILVFLFSPSLISFFLLIPTFFVDLLLLFFAQCILSMRLNNSMMRYLDTLIHDDVKLKKHEIEDYLHSSFESLKKINTSNFSDASPVDTTLSVIYEYIPAIDKPLPAEVKAFILTNFPNPVGRKKFDDQFGEEIISYKSHIFFPHSPKKQKIIHQFFLLHEISHVTEEALNLNNRSLHHKLSIPLFLVLFYFYYGYNSIIPYILIAPYFIWVFGGFFRKISERKEEYLCDGLAVYFLQLKDNYEELEMYLKLYFKEDQERLKNVLTAMDAKKKGFNSYLIALMHTYPKDLGLFFLSTVSLFASGLYFDGLFYYKAYMYILAVIIFVGVVCVTFIMYYQIPRLFKTNDKIFKLLENT